MANQKDSLTSGSSESEALSQIAAGVRLLVKLKLKEIQGDGSTKEMILLLHALGCRPIEIADALGKSQEDVNPVISRSRKAAGGKGAGTRKGTINGD